MNKKRIAAIILAAYALMAESAEPAPSAAQLESNVKRCVVKKTESTATVACIVSIKNITDTSITISGYKYADSAGEIDMSLAWGAGFLAYRASDLSRERWSMLLKAPGSYSRHNKYITLKPGETCSVIATFSVDNNHLKEAYKLELSFSVSKNNIIKSTTNKFFLENSGRQPQ